MFSLQKTSWKTAGHVPALLVSAQPLDSAACQRWAWFPTSTKSKVRNVELPVFVNDTIVNANYRRWVRGCGPLKRGCDPLKRGCDPLKCGCDPLKCGCDPLKRAREPLKSRWCWCCNADLDPVARESCAKEAWLPVCLFFVYCHKSAPTNFASSLAAVCSWLRRSLEMLEVLKCWFPCVTSALAAFRKELLSHLALKPVVLVGRKNLYSAVDSGVTTGLSQRGKT